MSIRNNILISYLSQITNVIISFGISIITTRMLGVVGRGDFALFTNSLGLAAVWLGFSLPVAVIYYVSSNKIKPNKIFFTFSAFIFLTGLIVFGIVQLLKVFHLQQFIFPANHDNLFWVLLFCVQFLSTAFNVFISAFLNAKQKFVHISVISIIFTVAMLFLYAVFYLKIIVVPLDGFSLIIFTTLLLGILQLLANLFFYSRYVPDAWRFEWLKMTEIKQMITFSLIGWMGNAIQFLSYRLDLWFVDYHHGKVDTGVYSLSVTLAQLLWILPNVISNVLFSYLSNPEMRDKAELTHKFVKISFWMALISGIAFCIFCYLFVPSLYGQDFARVPDIILLLMLGIIPFSITPIIAIYHIAINKIKLNLFGAIVGFIVAVILYALLIPKYGITGACIGTIISYNINNFLLMKWFNRETNIPVWNIGISIQEFKRLVKGLKPRV